MKKNKNGEKWGVEKGNINSEWVKKLYQKLTK